MSGECNICGGQHAEADCEDLAPLCRITLAEQQDLYEINPYRIPDLLNAAADRIEALKLENEVLMVDVDSNLRLAMAGKNARNRWKEKAKALEVRLGIGPKKTGSIAEAFEALREAGGKAWDGIDPQAALDEIRGVTELRELKAMVVELPTYADTGEPFVPGRDEAWVGYVRDGRIQAWRITAAQWLEKNGQWLWGWGDGWYCIDAYSSEEAARASTSGSIKGEA